MSLSKLLSDRRIWLLAGVVAAFGLLRWSGLGSYLSLDALQTHRAALTAFVA